MEIGDLPGRFRALADRIGRVVFGSEELLRQALAAFMAGGHILLEGPPGVGKTLLVRALARTLGLEFRRIQCTPDLMPGDVLGTNIFDFRSQEFHLTRGPVFCEFLLADEINRTPPKTQAALLEAMQEGSVTIDGVTHPLPQVFFVTATQNPIEHEGTYPLPEAQLDRFLFKLVVPYPPREEEVHAVQAHSASAGMPDLDALDLEPLFGKEEVRALRSIPAAVRAEEDIARYSVDLVRATRDHPSLAVGLSTRAAVVLVAAGRAAAALDGRDYTVPDDLKGLFAPLARHRVILEAGAQLEGISEEEVLSEILGSVEPPR